MTKRWLRARREWLYGCCFLAAMLQFATHGQSQGGVWLDNTLGRAKGLSHGQSVEQCVSSILCLQRVGGVAFGGIAAPFDASMRVVGLRYDSTRPDGTHLRVTTESGQELDTELPDWLLVPTAHFAAQAQHAAFTLFGELADPTEDAQARARGYEILNYHPAFVDTLIGLRLFHADVLILAPASAALPTVSGTPLLGLGETLGDATANQQALSSLWSTMEDASGKQVFRSYLISDYQQQVHIRSNAGKLDLDGWPLWYLWRYSVSDEAYLALDQQARDEAYSAINAEYFNDQLTLSAAEVDAKYTDDYVQMRQEEIWDAIMSPEVLQPLLSESSALSTQIRDLGGINPTVYHALTSVMRYAALFRYVQGVAPDVFNQFVQSLPCAITPSLNTPTGYMAGQPMAMDSSAVPGPSTCGGAAQGGAAQGGAAQGGAAQGGAAQGGAAQGGAAQATSTTQAPTHASGGTSGSTMPWSGGGSVTAGATSAPDTLAAIGGGMASNSAGYGGANASAAGGSSANASAAANGAAAGHIEQGEVAQGGIGLGGSASLTSLVSSGNGGFATPTAQTQTISNAGSGAVSPGTGAAQSVATSRAGNTTLATTSIAIAGHANLAPNVATDSNGAGCSCRINQTGATNPRWLLVAFSALLAMGRRRRHANVIRNR